MTVEDKRFTTRAVSAFDFFASQLVASLVVEGAVLDGGLLVRHATAGFARKLGTGLPDAQHILHCIETENDRRRLVRFAESLALRQNLPGRLAAPLAQSHVKMSVSESFDASLQAGADADSVDQFLEVALFDRDTNVRISPLIFPGSSTHGFLVQELPKIPISHLPVENVGRIAPEARRSAEIALAQLSSAYWESNPVTGEFFASDPWYMIRGHRAQDTDIVDHEFWKGRVHPEDRATLFDYQRKLQTGEADFVPIIYRERHADGHWMTIMCKGAVIERDPKGTVVRVAGTDADITASHSTEEYIRDIARLEQRWLIATEYGQLGLWDNDEAAGTRYVSQTWRKMRGYGPDDAFDESREALVERTHPDDLAALEKQIQATVNGDTETVFQEYRERHRDGHWIWVLSRGRVISRDESGRATRIIGIDTDITEIKAASEKIYKMSQRLGVAVEATKVGIWDVDFANGEVLWDARMMEMYGLDRPPGAIPDNYWEDAIHPDDRERVLAQAAEVEAGNLPYVDDYRVIRSDGEIRYIRSRSTQEFEGENGNGLIGVDWDVTADVEAAAELSRAHALARDRNDELEKARAEMEYNALHDALTDLPNRRFLDRQMRSLSGKRQRISVMRLDLDRFKHINDTLGHAAGDAVLQHVARVMSDISPETATVARVGGDEFVILFETAISQVQLTDLAESISAELHKPIDFCGKECRFGVSVGTASGDLSEHTPDEVFENADMALYSAKENGRGRHVFFSTQMRTTVEGKRRLADALLDALERDEFFCVYQPQFEAGSLRLSGLEALVRWRRPDDTVAAPSVFLEMAEELGIVNRIDQRVLEHVMIDQDRWSAMGLRVPRVSVNVSARRLADPSLPDRLGPMKIAPGRIAFELLETVFLDTQDPVISANIAAIRGMGIEIEIDDFGTGHASIVGMLQLQPDRLKIDQQIVGLLTQGEKQGSLVRSIIDIGRLHSIDVIAEGVETSEHVRMLTAMGCDFLQGYGLAIPMPEIELRSRLRSGDWGLQQTGWHRQRKLP